MRIGRIPSHRPRIETESVAASFVEVLDRKTSACLHFHADLSGSGLREWSLD
jgi:hypothetical protein